MAATADCQIYDRPDRTAHTRTAQTVRSIELGQRYATRTSCRTALGDGQITIAHFADDIPDSVKRARNQAMLQQQDAVSHARNQAWVGRTVEVLVEGTSKTDASRVAGRTPEHRMAVFTGGPELAGTLVNAKVVRATAATLFCEPV